MDIIEGLQILLSWKILASSIFIYAVISFIKKTIHIFKDEWKNNKILKLTLTSMNMILGLAIAFHPSFLPGENLFERAIAGIVSGFLSSYVYQFIKRVFEEKNV